MIAARTGSLSTRVNRSASASRCFDAVSIKLRASVVGRCPNTRLMRLSRDDLRHEAVNDDQSDTPRSPYALDYHAGSFPTTILSGALPPRNIAHGKNFWWGLRRHAITAK